MYIYKYNKLKNHNHQAHGDLRCLGIKFKKKVYLKGLNKLHMKNKVFLK